MDFFKNNIGLIGLIIGTAALLLWPWLRSRALNIPELSPSDAVLLMNREDVLVLDVREAQEFNSGHIPNAKHIPLGTLDKRLTEIAAWKDKPILVNCKAGGRSANACGVLRRQGFTKLNNLAGGMQAWQSAHLPVEK